MASTRNKNTKSDYCLQQQSYSLARNYNDYINSQYGKAYDNAMPCIGYTPSHMPRDTLSNNPIEIETMLFGINSTNLVEKKTPIQPDLKQIKGISFFDRTKLLMPHDLEIHNNQRPFPI